MYHLMEKRGFKKLLHKSTLYSVVDIRWTAFSQLIYMPQQSEGKKDSISTCTGNGGNIKRVNNIEQANI
jgi:hypothetical protein